MIASRDSKYQKYLPPNNMSENQNIYQIMNYSDLIELLTNGIDEFIILTVVAPQTNATLKIQLKKYIKMKAKIFPNVTFLYYTIKKDDPEKISILNKNMSNYPKMCHIYNVTQLLTEISNIDSMEAVDDNFKKVEGYYIEDLKCDEEAANTNHENEEEIQSTGNKKEEMRIQTSMPTSDPLLEKKKNNEKLALFMKKIEDFNIEFLKDCKGRKEEEENNKKKKKNKD